MDEVQKWLEEEDDEFENRNWNDRGETRYRAQHVRGEKLLPGVADEQHPLTIGSLCDWLQERDRLLPAPRSQCLWCGGPLDPERPGGRSTIVVCSAKCRLALWRHRRKHPNLRAEAESFDRALQLADQVLRADSFEHALDLAERIVSELQGRLAQALWNLHYRGGHVSSHHDSVVQASLANRRADATLHRILSRPYEPWSRLSGQSIGQSPIAPQGEQKLQTSPSRSEARSRRPSARRVAPASSQSAGQPSGVKALQKVAA